MTEVIRAGVAFLLGISTWIPLRLYDCHRRQDSGSTAEGKQPDGWQHYFNSVSGIMIFGIGILGMIFSFCMAKYHGLPYHNCLRNELVFVWLLVIGMVDAREQLIPHGLTIPGFAAWMIWILLDTGIRGDSLQAALFFSLGGCLMGGGLFFLCRMITKDGVGMGDVRVFGILGLLYGMNDTFSIVFFTILLMAVYGIGVVLCKKKSMKSHIPMGPFILAAYILCCLLGV